MFTQLATLLLVHEFLQLRIIFFLTFQLSVKDKYAPL